MPKKYALDFTLLSPLHHGAGTAGNTALLRTQDVITSDGEIAQVPFVSANSIRHHLRETVAYMTCEAAGIEPGTQKRAVVDLLFSGGSITTTGQQADLALMRDVHALLPTLTLFAYAAGSEMHHSTLRVQDAILACEENRARLRDTSNLRRAAFYRSEEFGTRHDITNSPAGRYIATDEPVVSTQMIYDLQVLKPGARLESGLTLTDAATDTHIAALSAALYRWAGDDHVVTLGAKSAVGYGRVKVSLGTEDAAMFAPDMHDWIFKQIRDHATEVKNLLERMVK